MGEIKISKHLQEQFDQHIIKDRWFFKDEISFMNRRDWVFRKLVNAGVLDCQLLDRDLAYKVIEPPIIDANVKKSFVITRHIKEEYHVEAYNKAQALRIVGDHGDPSTVTVVKETIKIKKS